MKAYNFDIIQHDGHMVQSCGPSTGHSIRTVAMCESTEVASYLLTTVSAYDKHRALIETLVEVLADCEDYFDRRADADCDQDGYIPNDEMRMLQPVRLAMAAASREGF